MAPRSHKIHRPTLDKRAMDTFVPRRTPLDHGTQRETEERNIEQPIPWPEHLQCTTDPLKPVEPPSTKEWKQATEQTPEFAIQEEEGAVQIIRAANKARAWDHDPETGLEFLRFPGQTLYHPSQTSRGDILVTTASQTLLHMAPDGSITDIFAMSEKDQRSERMAFGTAQIQDDGVISVGVNEYIVVIYPDDRCTTYNSPHARLRDPSRNSKGDILAEKLLGQYNGELTYIPKAGPIRSLYNNGVRVNDLHLSDSGDILLTYSTHITIINKEMTHAQRFELDGSHPSLGDGFLAEDGTIVGTYNDKTLFIQTPNGNATLLEVPHATHLQRPTLTTNGTLLVLMNGNTLVRYTMEVKTATTHQSPPIPRRAF